jgi:hypothetical protein
MADADRGSLGVIGAQASQERRRIVGNYVVSEDEMAQLTIEIPDSLLPEAEQLQNELPNLIAQMLTASSDNRHKALPPSVLPASLYRKILEFLASNPGPEDILSFKAPAEVQVRMRELLDRNKAGVLTVQESSELDEYEKIEHFIVMIKAGCLQAFPIAA